MELEKWKELEQQLFTMEDFVVNCCAKEDNIFSTEEEFVMAKIEGYLEGMAKRLNKIIRSKE